MTPCCSTVLGRGPRRCSPSPSRSSDHPSSTAPASSNDFSNPLTSPSSFFFFFFSSFPPSSLLTPSLQATLRLHLVGVARQSVAASRSLIRRLRVSSGCVCSARLYTQLVPATRDHQGRDASVGMLPPGIGSPPPIGRHLINTPVFVCEESDLRVYFASCPFESQCDC